MKNYLYILFVFTFLISCNQEKKVGFVVNAKLFAECIAAKEAKKELSTMHLAMKNRLDSMEVELKVLQSNKKMQKEFQEKLAVYQSVSQKYQGQLSTNESEMTKMIWEQISVYIDEYGKENGYAFIHGAAGTGTMMYADKQYDITKELIDYVNKRYEDK